MTSSLDRQFFESAITRDRKQGDERPGTPIPE
jgi:hypothetical protein